MRRGLKRRKIISRLSIPYLSNIKFINSLKHNGRIIGILNLKDLLYNFLSLKLDTLSHLSLIILNHQVNTNIKKKLTININNQTNTKVKITPEIFPIHLPSLPINPWLKHILSFIPTNLFQTMFHSHPLVNPLEIKL